VGASWDRPHYFSFLAGYVAKFDPAPAILNRPLKMGILTIKIIVGWSGVASFVGLVVGAMIRRSENILRRETLAAFENE
jgi:hypothetical protein